MLLQLYAESETQELDPILRYCSHCPREATWSLLEICHAFDCLNWRGREILHIALLLFSQLDVKMAGCLKLVNNTVYALRMYVQYGYYIHN